MLTHYTEIYDVLTECVVLSGRGGVFKSHSLES